MSEKFVLNHGKTNNSGVKPNNWIPVTEALPVKEGKFLVCGQWRGKPMQIWICERIKLGPILFGWANRAENPVISHWMPLPEPPKEETG